MSIAEVFAHGGVPLIRADNARIPGWQRVREYLADPDSTASYQQFQGWLKERKPAGAPSGQTVRNRLGTWKDILERARA